jgi:hypothetical protein
VADMTQCFLLRLCLLLCVKNTKEDNPLGRPDLSGIKYTMRALKYCGGGKCLWGRILIGFEYANMGYIGHIAQHGAVPPLFLAWPRGRGGGRNRRTGDCVSVGCVSSHLLWTRPSGGHPVMKFFSTSRAKIAGGPIVAYGHNLPLKRRYDSFGQPTHAVLRLVGSVCTLTSRMSPSQWMGHEGTVTVCFRWLLPLLHG